MMSALFGPLAGPECRRSASRSWPILARTAYAAFGMLVVFCVLWWWAFRQGGPTEPLYLPFSVLRGGLTVLEAMALTVVLALGPAVLGASLAGERERGAMGLLLSTRVSAREIVTGRLAGKLGTVLMILLAGVPNLALIAALAGLSMGSFATLVGLPVALSFGVGGMALAASAVSKRGRDAVFAAFAIELLTLLIPLLGMAAPGLSWTGWLDPLNPFSGLSALAWGEQTGPALATIGAWTALGLIGIAIASWRLRASCVGGVKSRRSGRGWLVPPLGERPMLWKELHIERVGTLGRFGKVLGFLLVLSLGGGSLALAGVVAWNRRVRPDPAWEGWAMGMLIETIGLSAPYFGYLLQWSIGLRAAVSISSERERGTWDALLTSPLEGTEIVLGKLWGSLFALRWLVGASALAWTLALACGAMSIAEYLIQVANVVVIGAFMAAIGVRFSLETASATRAMTLTMAAWLLMRALAAILAAFVFAVGAILWMIGTYYARSYGLIAGAGGLGFPIPIEVAWAVLNLLVYAVAAPLIATETRLRFDRIAGRLAGGKTEVAVDRLVHGEPFRPRPRPHPTKGVVHERH